MNNKQYFYCFLDFSLILTRSLFVISKGKDIGEYTAGELIRTCIWTINKVLRDYGISARKVILVYDKWDESIGGYYTSYLLGGQYKDTRHYMDETIFEGMKNDPAVSPDDLKKAAWELYQNQVKQTAKYTMISELPRFGIGMLGRSGWEADNWAYLLSCELYGKTDLPSLFVTKDSDWMYCLSPATQLFRLPGKNEEPRIITYDEMYYSIPESIRNAGIGLYQYLSLKDSLGYGHNDLRKTVKPRVKSEKVILEVLSGNYENLTDLELFEKQYKTFDIFSYPGIDEARDMINNYLPVCGSLGDVSEFRMFCRTHNIPGISDSYYSEFIGRLDQKLYCE